MKVCEQIVIFKLLIDFEADLSQVEARFFPILNGDSLHRALHGLDMTVGKDVKPKIVHLIDFVRITCQFPLR